MTTQSIQCNEDPSRFGELGYCIFRNGLTATEVAFYSADMEEKLAKNEFKGEPHYYYESWRKLCCHPYVLDAVETILGPELILFFSSVFAKQPRDEKRVEWHQDNTYWSTVSGTDVVTAWVALDDVDEQNACMKVIPGSHAGNREMEMQELEDMSGAMLQFKVDVTSEMEASAVPIVLKAGEFSIHDSFIVHGSGPNASDRRRAGYTIRYGNAMTTSVDEREHKYSHHPPLPIYYIRGSGEGMHDSYRDARGEGR